MEWLSLLAHASSVSVQGHCIFVIVLSHRYLEPITHCFNCNNLPSEPLIFVTLDLSFDDKKHQLERSQYPCKAERSSAGPFAWQGAVTSAGWRWSESRMQLPDILANAVTYAILGLSDVS